jgi:hypothetical protein
MEKEQGFSEGFREGRRAGYDLGIFLIYYLSILSSTIGAVVLMCFSYNMLSEDIFTNMQSHFVMDHDKFINDSLIIDLQVKRIELCFYFTISCLIISWFIGKIKKVRGLA